MEDKSNGLALKIAVAAAFVAMVVVNYLAQALPINGATPGQISDSLPNLFTPAGLTFSVWGVIYLMLAVFTVYQFFFRPAEGQRSLDGVRALFIASSLINIAWIFSWHYRAFALSMGLMLLLLVSLIAINRVLDRRRLAGFRKALIALPFSLYFGWITVATVANATALFVHLGWDRLGLPEEFWAVVILLVAMLIGSAAMIARKDVAYGLVLIWAYVGILLKHVSPANFAGAYPWVIGATVLCLAAYVAGEFYTVRSMLRRPA
jgi:hypothetical protein